MSDRPDPETVDPTTAPFWRAVAERRFLLQRCRACGRYQHYPRNFCFACLSLDVEWAEAKGTGTVYSMTTVRRGLGFVAATAYSVGLIQLDEGPRVFAGLRGEGCAIGAPVRLAWQDQPDGPPLYVFETTAG